MTSTNNAIRRRMGHREFNAFKAAHEAAEKREKLPETVIVIEVATGKRIETTALNARDMLVMSNGRFVLEGGDQELKQRFPRDYENITQRKELNP